MAYREWKVTGITPENERKTIQVGAHNKQGATDSFKLYEGDESKIESVELLSDFLERKLREIPTHGVFTQVTPKVKRIHKDEWSPEEFRCIIDFEGDFQDRILVHEELTVFWETLCDLWDERVNTDEDEHMLAEIAVKDIVEKTGKIRMWFTSEKMEHIAEVIDILNAEMDLGKEEPLV